LQRRFTGEPGDVGPLRLQRIGEQGEDRIVAQLVVVVEVLIAERLAMNALRNERLDRVHDAHLIAPVAEAARPGASG
jgi:hypothetical protein